MLDDQGFKTGQLIAGTQYRVIAEIGRGGMGAVYEVEHEVLGKHFVLKALLRDLSSRDDLVQRLRNEWRALGQLQHRNIVSVSDAGVSAEGVPFYVMERLQGDTLAARLDAQERFDMVEAVRIAREILAGLSAAHEIGIVHRDIKPPNIFLAQDGAVKILDFGIAKILHNQEKLTSFGMAIGTPRYMSPEQAAGENLDGRADLYAVGLLLFEMISGQSPFEGADAQQLVMAHLNRPAPRLSSLVSDVDPMLDDLVDRLLQKQPQARMGSAQDVLMALEVIMPSGASFGYAAASVGSALTAPTEVPPIAPRHTIRQDTHGTPQNPPKSTLWVPNKSTRRYAVDGHLLDGDRDSGASSREGPATANMHASASGQPLVDEASATHTSEKSAGGRRRGRRQVAAAISGTPPPVSGGDWNDLQLDDIGEIRPRFGGLGWGLLGGAGVLVVIGIAALVSREDVPLPVTTLDPATTLPNQAGSQPDRGQSDSKLPVVAKEASVSDRAPTEQSEFSSDEGDAPAADEGAGLATAASSSLDTAKKAATPRKKRKVVATIPSQPSESRREEPKASTPSLNSKKPEVPPESAIEPVSPASSGPRLPTSGLGL